MIKSLLDLELTKTSKDIRDYDLLIYGESGIGKSEFALDLYGRDRTIALAFEDSYTGISGAYAVNIDSYSTLTAYLTQLQDPRVREKYDTVVIDTLFLLDHYIEKSICNSYGVDLLGDALKYNKAYKIVDKKFLTIIKNLQKMGYTIVYIAHPVVKKVEIGETEINKYEPRVSDRIKNLLLPEVDIQLFCFTDGNGNRKIATQKTQYWDARCRVSEVAPCLDFDPETFKEEFIKGLEKRQAAHGGVIEKKVEEKKDTRTFEELMVYLTKDLATQCQQLNVTQKANTIIMGNLGRDNDGKNRTLADVTHTMIDTVRTIIIELEDLLAKSK